MCSSTWSIRWRSRGSAPGSSVLAALSLHRRPAIPILRPTRSLCGLNIRCWLCCKNEHLYLFSQRSVRQLFERVGLGALPFESALFPYDMFLLAGRGPLTPIAAAARDKALLRSPAARLVRAMIELDDRARDLSAQALRIEEDRQDRIRTIERLNRHIEQTSIDYDRIGVYHEALKVILDQQATIDRLSQDMTRLSHHIERTSLDSEARLKIMRDQHATIGRLGQEAKREKAERQRVLDEQARAIAELTAQGQTQLGLIARQQATVEALYEGERRRAGELETRFSDVEKGPAALAQKRLVRLLRHLRIL
jgi:hypothetical protein